MRGQTVRGQTETDRQTDRQTDRDRQITEWHDGRNEEVVQTESNESTVHMMPIAHFKLLGRGEITGAHGTNMR